MALSFAAVLIAGCSGAGTRQLAAVTPLPGTASGVTPTVTPMPATAFNVTPPAPTPPPGSTAIPWWGSTIARLEPEPGLMGKPADLAVAEDGTIYLADTGTHRIYHIDTTGNVIDQWGGFSGEGQSQPAQAGTFNQPWGLTIGPDGTVYIADTWNHRIQVFSPGGDFIRTWGEAGQGDGPYQLFGPRDVAVNASGLVFVSDTGNKRIVAYTGAGEYIAQIGGEGEAPGQFNEPVGIAFSPQGDLYVADQGNRRVQVLSVAEDGALAPKAAWPVDAWQHNDPLYKPYLCVMGETVFLTDTEAGSVQEYTTAGEYRTTFNLNTTGYLNYGLLYGIASTSDRSLWASDLAGGAGVLVRIFPGR